MVLNGLNLFPVAAFFLPTPVQFVAGVIPTFWPMRALWSAAAGDPYVGFLAIGAAVNLVALAVAAHLFEQRLLRRG